MATILLRKRLVLGSRCFIRQRRALSGLDSSTKGQLLAYQSIKVPSAKDDPPIIFLHGLLGNARNIKTMANTLCKSTNRNGLILDITGHGQSKRNADPNPHAVNFDRATRDIHHTLQEVLQQNEPIIQMVGHSLGGRLALYYASRPTLQPRPQTIWLLDTVPGQLDTSVLQTLQAAESIVETLSLWESRQAVTDALVSQHKLSRPIATWLASQFSIDDQSFAFSIPAAMALARDFENQDFWSQLDTVLHGANTDVHLVQAGKNTAWNTSAQQDALRERSSSSSSFHHHILQDAGHWVHIDAPKGLQALFLEEGNDW